MIHQLPKCVPGISVLAVWTATGKMKRFVIKRTLHVKTFKILGTIMSNYQEFPRITNKPSDYFRYLKLFLGPSNIIRSFRQTDLIVYWGVYCLA